MNVALRFLRPEIESIKSFALACEEIGNLTARYHFTFVVPDNLVDYLGSQIQNFGITSYSLLQDRRSLFQETVECTGALSGIESDKRQLAAMRHIASHIDMLSIPDAKLNPVENGLVLEGVCDPCDGYGSSTEIFLSGLGKLGVNCTFVPTRTANHWMMREEVLAMINNKNLLYHAYLLYHTPMFTRTYTKIRPRSSRNILTMFETTSIPSDWVYQINTGFDQLIVPSNFCKDVFADCGINIKTSVVPLGIDTEAWPFFDRTKRDRSKFKFLIIANAHWTNTRKNYPIIVDAFSKAFGHRSDVELILKISGGFGGTRPRLGPNVRVIDQRLPHEALVSLMHEADCFLFPSNGEGYGLPPREAMATGLPVILTNWSSLSDICRPELSYWVEASGTQRADLPKFLWSANNGSSNLGEYARIKIEDLAEVMLHVYNYRDDAYQKGIYASKWIRKHEDYKETSLELSKALDVQVNLEK